MVFETTQYCMNEPAGSSALHTGSNNQKEGAVAIPVFQVETMKPEVKNSPVD